MFKIDLITPFFEMKYYKIVNNVNAEFLVMLLCTAKI